LRIQITFLGSSGNLVYGFEAEGQLETEEKNANSRVLKVTN